VKERKQCAGDVNMVLRRCKLPRNWRQVSSAGAAPEHVSAGDLRCGDSVDCYGRRLLLLDCDAPTREAYRGMGVEQSPLDLVRPQDRDRGGGGGGGGDRGGDRGASGPGMGVGVGVGGIGDIGGGLKASRKWSKAGPSSASNGNSNSNGGGGGLLRCRAEMVSADRVNSSRRFVVTYHLEDDTLGVAEEAARNSGIAGGAFLKRGPYLNALPEDCDVPRPFKPADIYLGNVVSVGGSAFGLLEMDEASVCLCEGRPLDFPLFDCQGVAGGLLYKVYR
jgi:hypothetical protein